ncbi:MAG: biotin/lipoyl-binding protein [Planctomycetota bacterium]|nr:MAG: biotin/lipoyl-binding protein [Planctomycetota bacterium]REK23505.1 MAG: biotin/lipoyl-binding protein [Planctomycetota bacterium]
MSTASDPYVSSSARPLPIIKRDDLFQERQKYLGRPYWILKDPIALTYYRFQPQEFAILNMLDGETSIDQIKERFEAEFPPHKITVEEIATFIGRLHQGGLVRTHLPGQGKQLKKRRDEKLSKQRLARMSNVLAIRFRGVDPEKFLNWLEPRMRWFFSPLCVAFCCALSISAMLLVAVQFREFNAKLPGFHEFFAGENWIWLILAMGVTKVLHEIGHGLFCKYFGGECHEIGVMLLALTPCLYCNVSDSWMLPNKWHRAAIGAAGMYVEVVIASICTFIWWFTDSTTLLNQVCLSVMFVSSVSTVIFNGNPLLRYDGYYILSDISEIPNLQQKSRTILNNKMGKWFLGLEEPDDPYLPQRRQGFFALYTVASTVYRWIVVLSILFFLNKIFEPYGLKVIGQMIALAAMYGLVIMPLWKLFKFFRVPGRLQKVKRPRMYASMAAVAVLLLAIWFIPLPHSIICALQIQPHGADTVYVEVPGILEECRVEPGQAVKQGDVLAVLRNPDLELQVLQLRGERNQYASQITALRHLRLESAEAGEQIPELEESLAKTEEQLARLERDLEKLTLRAPRDGIVMPVDLRPQRPGVGGQLPSWSGFPTDTSNLGTMLDGDFCRVGDPTKLEAEIVVEQSDVEFVVPKQSTVDIKLRELPSATFRSQIADVSPKPIERIARRMTAKAGGSIPSTTEQDGGERPLTTSYYAQAVMPDDAAGLHIGALGEARIYTRWRTLGERVARYLNRTFSFDL